MKTKKKILNKIKKLEKQTDIIWYNESIVQKLDKIDEIALQVRMLKWVLKK